MHASEFWWLVKKDEKGWGRLGGWLEVMEIIKVGGKAHLRVKNDEELQWETWSAWGWNLNEVVSVE